MPAPARIAVCITELDPGGAERALVEVLTRVDRAFWQPKVWCLSHRGEMSTLLEAADIPVVHLGCRGLRDLFPAVAALTRDWRTWQPDLVQSWLFHGNLVGGWAARRAGVRHVVAAHRVAERSRWRAWAEWATQNWYDRHVAVSQGVAEHLRERCGLSQDKITVIGNGVDFARFTQAEPASHAALGLPANARLWICVGRLDTQKGHHILIEAIAPLLRDHPLAVGSNPVHLLIVGDGPLRGELEKQASRLGVSSRIHFLGRRTDVPALMRAAELFVLPSLWEGMPNVLLEGLAAGAAVVTTRVEGVEEILAASAVWTAQTVVVSPGIIAELQAALLVQQQAGKRSLPQPVSCEDFTWPAVTQCWMKLWSQVLQSGCRGTNSKKG